MSYSKRIYLAGPEVFLRDPLTVVVQRKKELCKEYGFIGVYPLDSELKQKERQTRKEFAFRISLENEDLIDNCKIVIANLTPFRGPSADPGTVYEIGYACALDKKVLGYSNDPREYSSRVRAFYNAYRSIENEETYLIEDTGLHDNLMIDGGIDSSTFTEIQTPDTIKPLDDLEAFEKCLKILKRQTRKTDLSNFKV